MRALLLRPRARERFGLGPFFRVEPLGLEYLAAALEREGHEVQIRDLRLTRTLGFWRPDWIGISCIHTLDVPETLALARRVKQRWPGVFVMVGGHAASADPDSFATPDVDAVGLGPGERSVPRLVSALATGASLQGVLGFRLRGRPSSGEDPEGIDPALLPARDRVAPYRAGYRCVHRSPIWALETGRGCPFRCSFCAVGRAEGYRARDITAVRQDFEAVGGDVFVIDDLFFYPRGHSRALAQALAGRSPKKRWLLAQTRADTVVKSADVLEAWRPLAERFDLFFGFEAATDRALSKLQKDATVGDTEQAVQLCRELGFGVTGNFVIDPDYGESDFEDLWALLDRLRLDRVGFTVLTPLPGTDFHQAQAPRLAESDFTRFDMHHVLWEPRLGRRRFYELMVESWKRNVLSSSNASRRWLSWFRSIGPREALALAGVLYRTQRLMNVDAYLNDTFPPELPAVLAE
ncbi:MAG: cobalamin B12-binding domain-containing protein [Myxococcales bacterium]|nr:cobalamin B12-binding domain-containing protein [Myxococcales bacterium]